MNRRRFMKAATSLAVSSTALFACADAYVTLRYRLTIAVRVAGRLYEGSSVIETAMSFTEKPLLPEMARLGRSSRGEAVIIDLGELGLLFGLLYPEDARFGDFNLIGVSNLLFSFLPTDRIDRPGETDDFRDLQRLQGEFRLPETKHPTLLRFHDLSDPTTYEVIDPSKFAEIYGSGSSYEGATISIPEDDPITQRIDKVLPWLASARLGYRVAGRLSGLNFKFDSRFSP